MIMKMLTSVSNIISMFNPHNYRDDYIISDNTIIFQNVPTKGEIINIVVTDNLRYIL